MRRYGQLWALVIIAGVILYAGTAGTGISIVDETSEDVLGHAENGTSAVANATLVDYPKNRSEQAFKIHKEINERRAAEGLEPLLYSDQLQHVAMAHSYKMQRYDSFSHVGPQGSTLTSRYKEYGVQCSASAENIYYYSSAAVSSDDAFAEQVVDSWMGSEGHRKNVISQTYSAHGIGVVSGDNGTYVTQNFCR